MVNAQLNSWQHIFNLLVLFRWLSLIPPLAAIFFSTGQEGEQTRMIAALLGAVLINVVISFFTSPLNHALKSRPWVLGLDLLLAAGLMALTGGWRSPYYLYVLSPLLVAAFFFQVRGALLAVSAFLPLYFGAILLDINHFDGSDPEWLVVTVFIIGSYLIGITVGYVSLLLAQLQFTQDTLYRAHRELRVLHDLSTSLQRSASVDEVEKQALVALTRDLGFCRATIGLIDNENHAINNWQEQDINHKGPRVRRLDPVPIDTRDNPIGRAIRQQRIERFRVSPKTVEPSPTGQDFKLPNIMDQFGIVDGLALPMLWGIHPIGMLLVDLDGREEDAADLTVLDAIAGQTAVTLGVMMTRLRRAKESAIQEERTRIALDLHDTISQSLFGLVYTLQGCLKLLPVNPEAIEPELEWALTTAEDVRKKIRATIHNMWPAELTAQQFETDLRTYTADVLQAAELEIVFDIRGEFNTLSPPVRRGIYRICQESLTNIVHHAAAHKSRICVDVADGRARFILRDNGRGFEPEVALAQDFEGDHFGLRGIRKRAAALGGTCEIYSHPGAGTSILIDIPANAQNHHE
jgi:signal transduction histidine kinase